MHDSIKVLHAAYLKRPIPGIIRQMSMEKHAATELQINWDTKIFCSYISSEYRHYLNSLVTVSNSKGNWFSERKIYYQWLAKNSSKDYDVVLLRYAMYDPFQYLFVNRISKPVGFVHHTLEVPELLHATDLSGNFKACIESLIGFLAINKSAFTVGVTPEITEYERKRSHSKKRHAIVYPNGVLFDSTHFEDRRNEIPEILFIASSFVPWHGLDLLLLGLKRTSEQFILHLVGKVNRADLICAQGDQRIVIHGIKEPSEVQRLTDSCWIGLSSFALQRKNMTQACTLKVREYLRAGLPVYAGHSDVFPANFPFYKQGPPDIEQILAFAYSVRNISKEEISNTARPFIDKVYLLKRLYVDIQKIIAH